MGLDESQSVTSIRMFPSEFGFNSIEKELVPLSARLLFSEASTAVAEYATLVPSLSGPNEMLHEVPEQTFEFLSPSLVL
ncbi:hypothetical protein HY993_01845 [Candidatus Micrarchaeota archaeon]|nr:hypothetical protein [Candidatus Micrarchaeota archaeon]